MDTGPAQPGPAAEGNKTKSCRHGLGFAPKVAPLPSTVAFYCKVTRTLMTPVPSRSGSKALPTIAPSIRDRSVPFITRPNDHSRRGTGDQIEALFSHQPMLIIGDRGVPRSPRFQNSAVPTPCRAPFPDDGFLFLQSPRVPSGSQLPMSCRSQAYRRFG